MSRLLLCHATAPGKPDGRFAPRRGEQEHPVVLLGEDIVREMEEIMQAVGVDAAVARSQDTKDFQWQDALNMGITQARQHGEILAARGQPLAALEVMRKGAAWAKPGQRALARMQSNLNYKSFMMRNFQIYRQLAIICNNAGSRTGDFRLLEESVAWLEQTIETGNQVLGPQDPTVVELGTILERSREMIQQNVQTEAKVEALRAQGIDAAAVPLNAQGSRMGHRVAASTMAVVR